jgi:energy-converting hydrogenase Eha subunit E
VTGNALSASLREAGQVGCRPADHLPRIKIIFIFVAMISMSHIFVKTKHILGILFFVTEQEFSHKTEIPVAMPRGF